MAQVFYLKNGSSQGQNLALTNLIVPSAEALGPLSPAPAFRTAMIQSGLVGSLGGVPREQKMLKGHLPRVIYRQVTSIRRIIRAVLEPGNLKPIIRIRRICKLVIKTCRICNSVVRISMIQIRGLGRRPCAPIFSTHHTVDYEPFIKSQLASMQLTAGPFVLQIWSRNTSKL